MAKTAQSYWSEQRLRFKRQKKALTEENAKVAQRHREENKV